MAAERERLDGHVEALERLDPSDEEHHRRVVETDCTPRSAAVARGEESMIDPEGDHLDAIGVGPVQVDELEGFHRGGRADGVAAPHHRRLGLDPPEGLVVAGLRLDPGEGMEGGDQRQRPLVLEEVAGGGREPVVGVEDVDAAVTVEVGGHGLGEHVDHRGELLLGEVDGACPQVDDLETRLDGDPVGQAVVVTPDVHPDVDAGLGERRRELAHVDVHPAAVAGARLGERRGVHGEHRHRGHGASNRRPG